MEQNEVFDFINKINSSIKNLADSLNSIVSKISNLITIILESILLVKEYYLKSNTQEYVYINIMRKNCYFERLIEWK